MNKCIGYKYNIAQESVFRIASNNFEHFLNAHNSRTDDINSYINYSNFINIIPGILPYCLVVTPSGKYSLRRMRGQSPQLSLSVSSCDCHWILFIFHSYLKHFTIFSASKDLLPFPANTPQTQTFCIKGGKQK